MATIFKDCFQCRTIQRTAYNSFELQLLLLDSNSPVAVAVIYRPPKPHKDFLSDFADFLGGIMSNFERFLIMGDFNIHICCPQNSFVKDFINLTEDFDLVQLVTRPTHIKGHTLDLILSHGILLSEIEICDHSFSDHNPITFNMPLALNTINLCKTGVKTRRITDATSTAFAEAFEKFFNYPEFASPELNPDELGYFITLILPAVLF